MDIYDFKVRAQDGGEVSLSDYKGKVLLIVNTATGCGFTPQYDELQDLYELHQKDGLEILDFPCNQFAGQAPGSDEEIHDFCTGHFGITFPQFSKLDVLGPNASPLFKYLTENATFEGFGADPMTLILKGVVKKMDKDYKNNSNIKWNFTKFLIDRDGGIVARFEPTAGMKDLKAIPLLIEGWTVEDIENKLTGVLCGRRPTSCADQLAKAVRAAYEAEQQAS